MRIVSTKQGVHRAFAREGPIVDRDALDVCDVVWTGKLYEFIILGTFGTRQGSRRCFHP